MEIALRVAKKSDRGTKLELKSSNGVFELMMELSGSSMEDGTAKVIGAGNVESLQNVCRKSETGASIR